MKVYRNLTGVCSLDGVLIYMNDVVNACLRGRLNLFLQGDTGSGKTQLARDAMGYFGTSVGDGTFAEKVIEQYEDRLDAKAIEAMRALESFQPDRTLFVLGRNDMDTRELFQQINLGKLYQRPKYNLEPLVNPDTGEVEYFYPKVDENGIFVYRKLTDKQAEVVRSGLEKLAGSTEHLRELTSKINTNLIVVDELPNCVPAVRAQLFNLFDGFVEINGRAYPIGEGYSVGIATGNIGQQFTESSNDLGRALKDRMHVIVDVDYFHPGPSDTLEILSQDTNPRVRFDSGEKTEEDVITKYQELSRREIPLEKMVVANYLMHGLDYCSKGSKRKMKSAWPTQLENHEQGSDVGLVLPVSVRGAKSIIRLSQALDDIVKEKGAENLDYFESMMQAYKLVSAYSGVLNEADVQGKYGGNHYEAIDAVIDTTKQQFSVQSDNISAGLEMAQNGKKSKKVMDLFGTKQNPTRWTFMRETFERLLENWKEKGK